MTFRKRTERRLLSALVTEKCPGREKQVTDEDRVLYLKEHLEAGRKFDDLAEVTEDNVVIKGHHRIAAWQQFYAQKYGVGSAQYKNAAIDVVVLSALWSDEATRPFLLCTAFNDNDKHKGVPLSSQALRVHVSRLRKCGMSLEAIIRETPSKTPPQIKKAWTYSTGADKGHALRFARQLHKQGEVWEVAIEKANAAYQGVELDATRVGPKHVEDEDDNKKIRMYKVTDHTQKLMAGWNVQFENLMRDYDEGMSQPYLETGIGHFNTQLQRIMKKVEQFRNAANEKISQAGRISNKTVAPRVVGVSA